MDWPRRERNKWLVLSAHMDRWGCCSVYCLALHCRDGRLIRWTGGFEEQAATRARAKCVAEALWDAVGKIEEVKCENAFSSLCGPTRSCVPIQDRAGEDNSAIVVVSHGLFLDAVYCELLGMSNVGERSSFFMTANCSVSVMMFSESHRKRRCGFVCHGSIAHLPAELRTGHSIGGLKLDQKWVALS